MSKPKQRPPVRQRCNPTRVGPWLLALAAWSTVGCSSKSLCQTNDDCAAGQICLRNECVTIGDATCSTTEPCPSGQHCCGGSCGEGRCCDVRSDCPGGYCRDGRCQDGARPGCPEEACPTGVCQMATGLCVECLTAADCSDDRVCSNNSCINEGSGCTVAACASQGLICSPQEGCRACLPATSDCGNQVCIEGSCVPCDATRDCPGGMQCLADGTCNIPEGTTCTSNADCGSLVCKLFGTQKQCTTCLLTAECGADRTCEDGTCDGGDQCVADSDCNPPASICNSGKCGPGCEAGGCPDGQACSLGSGRCFPVGDGNLDLGDDCIAHYQCLSGACWLGEVEFQTVSLCSQACTTHDHCPPDHVCWELGDGNMCVPIRRAFDEPYPRFDGPPGASCSGDADQNTGCRTGYCRSVLQVGGVRVCMETCGRDADCANLVGLGAPLRCVSGWPIGADLNNNGYLEAGEVYGFTQLCHEGWGFIADNLPCGTGPGGSVRAEDHDTCKSGWCVQTPDFSYSPRCAQPCCTPSDCGPSKPICKPIDSWDGVKEPEDVEYGFQKVCLWNEYAGTKEIGQLCTTDSECKSEICTSASTGGTKYCTHTCCSNDDCAGYDWAPVCRKPNPPGSNLPDSNYTGVTRSLGRALKTGPTSTGQVAAAEQMLCLPP